MSEDLQDGQTFEDLHVVNAFLHNAFSGRIHDLSAHKSRGVAPVREAESIQGASLEGVNGARL
jgi:hypothetical protein